MNTIQCPVCKQMLEGEFQMTDKVKCPTCETAFVPANVLARQKEPIVLQSRGPNSFAKEDAGVQDSTPPPRDVSREKSSQGTNPKIRNERPELIVWTVATWIGALVFRNIVLFCFVAAALAMKDKAFFESEIALYFTSCFVVLPVSVVVAWHLYKGKPWAKVLYSVFAVFTLLTAPIYHFGTKAMSMDSMVRNHITFLPNWVLNIGVLWGVVVLVVFICGLRWVNTKESRAWLKSKKGAPNNKPWWIWVLLFNLLSIVALIVTFKSFMGVDSKDRLERTKQSLNSKQSSGFQDYFVTRQKEQERREAAEQMAREERESTERKAREARELAERKEREEREARELVERRDREVREKKERDLQKQFVDSIIGDMVQIPGRRYMIGKTEVTQRQWRTVLGSDPSQFKGDNNPVESVSWNDCQKFLAELNSLPVVKEFGVVFRLPTESEWEFACRAGATGKYCKLETGTESTKAELGEVAWFEDNANWKPHPVGQKNPNAFGLYDMHGNVWEWTSTADGEFRVSRGGSWVNSARDCESSSRCWNSSSARCNFLGFRLCASGSRSTDSGSETINHVEIGDSISSNAASLSEEDRRLLVLLNHGKACLTTAKNELALNHFDKAREKFQEAANYLSSDALDKKSEWTDSLLTEVLQGLAEVNYRQALDQYNHKEFQSALSTCREARRYRHPKAQELFQTIQNAQRVEQEKKQAEKRETVENAVQRLKRAQEHLANNNLVPALEEYQTAERLLESVIKSGDEAVLETMRVQMRNGIGEVHYRYAVDFFKAKKYNEALAACRQAKSYNHPKAEALIQQIKKAKELNSK